MSLNQGSLRRSAKPFYVIIEMSVTTLVGISDEMCLLYSAKRTSSKLQDLYILAERSYSIIM